MSARAQRPAWASPLSRAELVSALSAVVLLASMVALQWYGLDRAPGRISGAERIASESGWEALTVIRWLIVLTVVAAVAAALVRVTGRPPLARSDGAAVVTILGIATTASLVYRVLIDLPAPASVVEQKLGACVGLLSAFGVALGGYHALRTSREQERGHGGHEQAHRLAPR